MKKSDFVAKAKPLAVHINGMPLEAKPRKFKTGSVGYYVSGKVSITLPDGTIGKLQVGGNITVCGSKEWPDDATASVPEPLEETLAA